MRVARTSILALAACALGCSKLIGANWDDPTIASGPPNVCGLPSTGDAHVRFADFVPSADRVDLCLTRTDGTTSFDGVPILATSGGACPPGVGYEQMLAPITVPSGSYKIAVVPAGHVCANAAATGQVTIPANGAATIAILMGADATPVVAALADQSAPSGGSIARFVNAIGGAVPMDFGSASASELPSTVTPLVTHVAFGSGSDYVDVTSLGAKATLGGASTPSTKATIVTTTPLTPGRAYTLFATGSATDVAFPTELFACDDGPASGFFASCGGVPFDVTIDSFNAYLWGPFAPLEALRRQPIIDSVGNFTSDVVCLTDVDSDDDKRAIIAAAGSRYPYSAWFADDVTTHVDDPTDQNGDVPAPFTTPACPAGSTQDTELQALVTCLETNCSTVPNDASGTIVDTGVACIEQSCGTQAAALAVESGSAGQQCWMCALAQLYGRTAFGAMQSACETDPNARMGFHGQSPTLLLSRFPLASTQQWVLPSTSIRAAITRATMSLQNGAALDVYCTQPTTPQDGTVIPYTGQYGNGQAGNQGWRQELLLQTQKIVTWVGVESTVKKRRALIAGDFSTGPGVSGGFNAVNPESFAQLSAAFTIAAPPSYVPQCTFCASNPILTKPGLQQQVQSAWTTYTMMSGIPVTDVASAGIALDTPVIPYSGYTVPLSAIYAFRSTVHVRP